MDLKKILVGLENADALVKQIESEIGKEFVPRTEFNTKNQELKERDTQLAELKASHDELATKTSDYDKTVADLTGKVGEYELNSLRTKIAYEKGIPFQLAGRLTGTDEESLMQDAESLSKLIDRKIPVAPLKDTEPKGKGEDAAYKALLDGLKGE